MSLIMYPHILNMYYIYANDIHYLKKHCGDFKVLESIDLFIGDLHHDHSVTALNFQNGKNGILKTEIHLMNSFLKALLSDPAYFKNKC